MASVFGNVLGYLCPKNQVAADETQTLENRPTRSSSTGRVPEGDDETDWVYDIEVRDDWQIVRKMDEEETELADSAEEGDEDLELQDEVSGMMEDVENWYGCRSKSSWQKSWYLAPPPCFTRSAPSPSTNPLENLLIEHPSMSVYLLPVAASSALHAALHRSAPPNIMGDTCSVPLPIAPCLQPRTNSPLRREAVFPPNLNDEEIAQPYVRPISHKRKRRLRAMERAPGATARASAHTENAHREVATVCSAAELDKQAQHEEKERCSSKKILSKNQIRRTNLLSEINAPKQCATRNGGKYGCLQ